MSKPVVHRPAADRDLDEIIGFLRKDSRQAARRFTDAVAAAARVIGDHPGIGSTRHAEIFQELPAPLRFHPVTDFPRILIYYVERADVVEIVRIWDAARGLEALMTDPDEGQVRELRPAYMPAPRSGSRPSP